MDYMSDSNEGNRLRQELKKMINSGVGRAHTDRLTDILRFHPEWHKYLINIYLSNEDPSVEKLPGRLTCIQ